MGERTNLLIFLAALASPIGFLVDNQARAPSISRLMVIVAVIFLMGVVISAALSLNSRTMQPVAPFAAIGIVVFTYFGLAEPLVPHISPGVFLMLGGLASVGSSMGAYVVSDRWAGLREAIAWVLATIVVVPLILITLGAATAKAAAESGPQDVVVIIVDGYAGSETLNSIFSYDSGPFQSALEDFGFQVIPDVRANYSMTYASLASMLDMNYVVKAGPLSDQTLRPRLYKKMQGNNAFVSSLRDAGYRYIHVESGWGGTRCGPEADICISAPFLEETVWNFSQRTALGPLMRQWFGHSFIINGLDRLDELSQLALDPSTPEVVIAHILLPHPPLFLSASCEMSYAPELDGMNIGTPFYSDETMVKRRAAYKRQHACINQKLLRVVENPAYEDSIVVVVGDHGTDAQGQLVTPVSQWTEAMVSERLNTILALRGCEEELQGNLINALRLVKSCVLGSPYQALPERLFLVPVAENHPDDEIIEVSPP